MAMTNFDWLDPANTAVLVIDKQGSYMGDETVISPLFNNPNNNFDELVDRIDQFIVRARQKGVPIIWTRMVESPNSDVSPVNISQKMIRDGTEPISEIGMAGFEFIGDSPQISDKSIIKRFYDSFAQTDLDEYLKSLNISNIIITGGFTSRCVLGTAFGANGHGYNVVVATDLVGNGASFQDENEPAIKIIRHVIGYAVPSSEIPW